MAAGNFINEPEEQRLVTLIRAMERATTGEIHVHLSKKVSRYGPMHDAARVFKKLGMDRTRHQNAVLIFIATQDRQLACLGAKAIHEKISQTGWQALVDELRSHFTKGDHYLGLHKAVEIVGAALATHFPPTGEAPLGEIPDDITQD